jgi:hypothetical protein
MPDTRSASHRDRHGALMRTSARAQSPADGGWQDLTGGCPRGRCCNRLSCSRPSLCCGGAERRCAVARQAVTGLSAQPRRELPARDLPADLPDGARLRSAPGLRGRAGRPRLVRAARSGRLPMALQSEVAAGYANAAIAPSPVDGVTSGEHAPPRCRRCRRCRRRWCARVPAGSAAPAVATGATARSRQTASYQGEPCYAAETQRKRRARNERMHVPAMQANRVPSRSRKHAELSSCANFAWHDLAPLSLGRVRKGGYLAAPTHRTRPPPTITTSAATSQFQRVCKQQESRPPHRRSPTRATRGR